MVRREATSATRAIFIFMVASLESRRRQNHFVCRSTGMRLKYKLQASVPEAGPVVTRAASFREAEPWRLASDKKQPLLLQCIRFLAVFLPV